MFVLKQANIACRQQMTTINLLQKHFKQLSYCTASNWYYILIQLPDRGNFMEMQYGFYRNALLAHLLSLAVKRAFTRTQEKLERDYLKHHCERSLKLCDWSSTRVSLFLLTVRS